MPDSVARQFLTARGEDERAQALALRTGALGSLNALCAVLQRRGAHTIWLFGSLQSDASTCPGDIDLAVEGLPGEQHFAALGELLTLAPLPVDLLRIEELPAAFAARVRSEGRLLVAG